MTREENTDGSDGTVAGSSSGTGQSSGIRAPLPEQEALEDALDGSDTPDDAAETVEVTETTDDVDTDADTGTDAAEAGIGIESNGHETESESGDEGGDETPESAVAEAETATQEVITRVLEFELDEEYYCLDIEYIEEIVKHDSVTRVPNTPEFVEGVVDLRGQITTILNPKVTIGKENTEASEVVVVFDAEAFEDQGPVGWVVDDVRRVSPITDAEVNDPPMQEGYVNGIVDHDDEEEFVIWTEPDLAFEETGTS